MASRFNLGHIWPVGVVAFLCAALVGVVAVHRVWAGDEDAPDATVDASSVEEAQAFPSRIEIVAMSCAACHGTDGRLRTAIPALAGRPAVILNTQLQAFKTDQMPGATVMPRITKGFTDEDLQALAEYFAALNPNG